MGVGMRMLGGMAGGGGVCEVGRTFLRTRSCEWWCRCHRPCRRCSRKYICCVWQRCRGHICICIPRRMDCILLQSLWSLLHLRLIFPGNHIEYLSISIHTLIALANVNTLNLLTFCLRPDDCFIDGCSGSRTLRLASRKAPNTRHWHFSLRRLHPVQVGFASSPGIS